MALKDMDAGAKILGGLATFALLLALLSDGEPSNDAWGGGATASAAARQRTDPPVVDAWTVGDDAALRRLPVCDGTAPFGAVGGTVRLPVNGPVTPFAAPDCQLDSGLGSGEAVRLVQHALGQCNRQPVEVDGVYGPATREAVSAVQEQQGVVADGVYGPQTRAVMSWPLTVGGGETACGPAPDVR
jgi:peptidoglycan hydrolase-like protein with peptidoglycan-binding domain